MARIRTIKPEFWSSPGMRGLELGARLLYVAMWNWADDHGRGTANPRELAGFAFPHDYDVDSADIRRMLGGIRRAFGVDFYEVAGRPYYAIPSWTRHQKIDKRSGPKHPGPEEGTPWVPDPGNPPDQPKDNHSTRPAESSGGSAEDPPSPTRDPGAGTGEQGNRGTGEKNVTSEIAPRSDASIDRPDVERLCNHLADRIEANGSKRPAITAKWRDSARLMLDRDGRTAEQIHAAIDWCQDSEFWRANVMSMPKLRTQYDTLRLQAQRNRTVVSIDRRQQATDDMFDRAMQRAIAREEGGQ